MPESTTSRDVGGLSGQTEQATTGTPVKPEGMTEQEWQEQLVRQGSETPDSGTAQPR